MAPSCLQRRAPAGAAAAQHLQDPALAMSWAVLCAKDRRKASGCFVLALARQSPAPSAWVWAQGSLTGPGPTRQELGEVWCGIAPGNRGAEAECCEHLSRCCLRLHPMGSSHSSGTFWCLLMSIPVSQHVPSSGCELCPGKLPPAKHCAAPPVLFQSGTVTACLLQPPLHRGGHAAHHVHLRKAPVPGGWESWLFPQSCWDA